MALYKRSETVRDFNGVVVSKASVRVVTGATYSDQAPLASLFQDQAGLIPLSNPVAADAAGQYGYWVEAGFYAEKVSRPGYYSETNNDLYIGALPGVTGPAGAAGPAGPQGASGAQGPAGPPDTTLRSDLADVTNPALGAGLVGHTNALTYAPLTVGSALAARIIASDLASTASGKGAALVGVKSTLTGGKTRTQHDKNADLYCLNDFTGVDPTGVTDSTVGIQAALDAIGLAGGGNLWCPGIYKFTTVNLIYPHMRLFGNGTMNGTINITSTPANITANTLDSFFDIEGLIFNNLAGVASKAALTMGNVRRGVVRACKFMGFDKGIHIPIQVVSTNGQHVARIIIESNEFTSCNYFIKGEDSYSHGASLSTADITVVNNEGTSLVTHVEIDSLDGITLTGNTFFSPGYPAADTTTANCVKLTYHTWTVIAHNKFFEPGLEAILLAQYGNCNIHDNQIVWPGERLESDAIKLTGTPIPGAYYGFVNIHDNNIYQPTGNGITIAAKGGRSKVSNNVIFGCGNSDHYFGVPALSGTQKSIITDADTLGIIVCDNYAINKGFNLATGISTTNANKRNWVDLVGDGTGLREEAPMRVITVTSGTTFDMTNWDQANLAHGSGSSVTSIGNSGVMKNVMLRAYNGNTTLVNGAALILKGGVNINIPSGGCLWLQIDSSGNALEIGRSF